jgi:plasmid stability protein
MMAQFIVRDLEEEVKVRLKRRALRHGRSMEEEIRHILRNAAKESGRPVAKLGSSIAARFRGSGLLQELPELKGDEPRAAVFKP